MAPNMEKMPVAIHTTRDNPLNKLVSLDWYSNMVLAERVITNRVYFLDHAL